ncbi:hypothetical protein CE91St43_27720 [Oscillospiraceae bacterium]|nr:hypothetical protein CE91St43_27720 [Oscillospiraceae bacterium]
MTFSEKFDFLLKLTGTSNSVLARHMRLDPSYISRLRHGSRSLPRDSEYLPKLCAFLLRQCAGEELRRALCQAVGAADGVTDESLERQIVRWLCDEEGDLVGALLSDFSAMAPAPKKQVDQSTQNEALAFYGDEGRRQSTIALFNLALQQPGPVTLLLYSDEDAAWMNKSSSFSYEWSTLLWQIILRGGKVKVIHKVSRNIDEMFDVIRRWLPFYASGAIEPYYYPRLRDGIYKRTLSVIPGVAAAFSTSIGPQTGVATTFMTRERQAVDSFTNEFSSYVALCRPLIEFFQMTSPAYLETFQEYLDRNTGSVLESDSLSLTTVPQKVIRRLEGRTDPTVEAALKRIHAAWSSWVTGNPSGQPICHILRLARPEDVAAGKVPISCAGLLLGQPVYYEPEEYCAQLEHILRLMETCPWFQVVLHDAPAAGYSLHVFEEQEVYIFKEQPPYIIFRIREGNTVMAFWDYLQRLREELVQDSGTVAERIRGCLKKIRALQKEA